MGRIEGGEKLIAAHDGDMALLYVYINCRETFDLETAAKELCRTKEQIAEAKEKLELYGLFEKSKEGKEKLPPAEKLSQYTGQEISEREKGDTVFRNIISEAGVILGHSLSTSEMTKIYGIYDDLALPPDVIVFMMHYCKEETDKKYHGSRSPFIRYLEKEAFEWYHNGITDYDRAEKYVAEKREKQEKISRYKRILGIYDRNLSGYELTYAKRWAEMNFDNDAIAEAYSRTAQKTGKLAWAYMDKILENWHSRNLHTLSEINSADPVKQQNSVKEEAYPSLTQEERERIKRNGLPRSKESGNSNWTKIKEIK